MPRYVSRPSKQARADADCDYWRNDPPGNLPTVSDSEPVDTGLLDANGDTLWRLPNPIGFLAEID